MRLARRFSLLASTLCTVLPSLSVAETTGTATTHRKASHEHSAKITNESTARVTTPTSTSSVRKKDNTKALYAADVETVNVSTGTHSTNRKARQSSSPVTVLTAATLRRSGQVNLADSLVRTYASINVQAMAADSAALTSSIQMRGLNPNEVLVLVDGKRRHSTANIVADAGPQFGSTGVDLNMIPANAIDHIEVLEDGAAAMYGSDAIAGVVNIITKKDDHGLHMSAQTGANAYNGDGWQYQLNADGGLKLGEDGYIHLSGQITHTDHYVVKTKDHRLLGYWPDGATTTGYYNGVVANAMKLPLDSNKIMSTPEETRENLAIDFGKKINDDIQFYGLITYAHRYGEAYENYRIPTIAPTYYPSGFSPLETIRENDYAATIGLKGDDFFGFDWDLSTTYGADETKIGNKNTANTGMLSSDCSLDSTSANYSSLGCGWTPTNVRAETYRLAQWTNNLDFRRHFNIAQKVPMLLAFGAEHRLETYDLTAGDAASYLLGGTQGYAGIGPQSAGSWSRDIWAGYVDGDFHPLKNWDLDFAGRFEHYTDVGNAENGKVSTRYDVTRRIAFRGTISTGFRAPTLPEQHYSAMNVDPNGASGLLPVDSAAARTLGASKLKPERSVSASGGVVIEPIRGLHVEADVYQINLRDRIVGGGTVNGNSAISAIEQLGYLLPSNGLIADNVSAYFMTNGASTRTQGLDIKADYTFRFRTAGTLALTLALDLNRTRLHHNALDTNGNPLLNAQNISYITTAYPRSKIILNAFYRYKNWDFNVRETRYGETTSMLTYYDWQNQNTPCASGGKLAYSNTCFNQFKNTPRWMTDIEIGYRFNKNWHMAVGVNNISDVKPRMVAQINNSRGAQPYDQFSLQVPITGAYYYGRLNADF
ncbi:TonB-dependent siderophore receptor [Acetobacter sp. DsW_54]|jgi:iron complex outermembrane receptor protein|uniref:TonB-dependent receptor plug domain-containing protein n=1 Tax=Acetobacter sp. DsW_54 TaxID=1670660 RepID=UPI000A38D2C8|nr:TonB-dependent receptor [Acetobacter sp. DsW_54]OUI97783.1 TonB-dependent receptor [Acetobacter sp. DsW_54]